MFSSFRRTEVATEAEGEENPPPQQQQQEDPSVTTSSSEQQQQNAPASTASISTDATTLPTTNLDPTSSVENLQNKISVIETTLSNTMDELVKTRTQLTKEKTTKRKLYASLIKLAKELKRSKDDTRDLVELARYQNQNWYEGGMWRGPALLPGVSSTTTQEQQAEDGGGTTIDGGGNVSREVISPGDLFLDLIIITAFSRIGRAIQKEGYLDLRLLLYSAIFYSIWSKQTSYSTRFDTTDLSSQVQIFVTCLAVLVGSFSCVEEITTWGGSWMMGVACFVSLLHFGLHARVWFWFKDARGVGSDLEKVKEYGRWNAGMNLVEGVVWGIGILFLEVDSVWKVWVFGLGVVLSWRLPKSLLPNDFRAATFKRGLLFILILGFLLQDIILSATPFFDYLSPTPSQYIFLFSILFLLYSIKLLYIDETYSIHPKDHALLINRIAGFFYDIGQFLLVVSLTVLGSGLNLLTSGYFAREGALPDNAKNLVCGGFASVVLMMGFIKSMHLRRVPVDPRHERLFVMAYAMQILVLVIVVVLTSQMCVGKGGEMGKLAFLTTNEIGMLFVLSGFAFVLVVMSWLDDAIELSLYHDGMEARELRVNPFGLWWCVRQKEDGGSGMRATVSHARMSQLSPLLSASTMSLFASQQYASISTDGLSAMDPNSSRGRLGGYGSGVGMVGYPSSGGGSIVGYGSSGGIVV